MISRRILLAGLATCMVPSAWAEKLAPEHISAKLVAAAEDQIGKTLFYDPTYRKLAYPGGDVNIETGVCTDVIIRAYRQGLSVDLQRLVHEDMRKNFTAYPNIWGLTRPDPNIDHRRVPNLRVFFKRNGTEHKVARNAADYLPGDIITMNLPGNLAHTALVTHHKSQDGLTPLCIHNIGRGAVLEDVLFAYDLTGHYRFLT